MKKVRRVNVREGYDLWAEASNPVVAMDARHTLGLLGERILDAGCGTGRCLGPMVSIGSYPVGRGAAGLPRATGSGGGQG